MVKLVLVVVVVVVVVVRRAVRDKTHSSDRGFVVFSTKRSRALLYGS